MEALLQSYVDEDDIQTSQSSSSFKVNLAPIIPQKPQGKYHFESPAANQVVYNPDYESIWAPLQGPTHPVHHRSNVGAQGLSLGSNNTLTGFATTHYMNDAGFDQLYKSYSTVISQNPLIKTSEETDETKKLKPVEITFKRKKREKGDPSDVNGYKGPWAQYEEEIKINEEIRKQQQQLQQSILLKEKESENERESENIVPTVAPAPAIPEETSELETSGTVSISTSEESEENRRRPTEEMEEMEAKRRKLEEKDEKDEKDEKEREKPILHTKSIYHGSLSDFKDYLGRSFVYPPSDLKLYDHECFLPKKNIHTWTGHTKGVSTIRFFPTYGHLLLSGSMDTTVKIWDVHHKRKCLRTYMGHSKAVRDVCFSNDGRKFISCGYDKFVLLWDTETGQCIGSYTSGRIPYCGKFHPDADKQNIFLIGQNDKRIVQWDINIGKIVQKYDQHLGAVNSITFIDDNRRFVSSSDDKSLRIWDWGIPVVIKYISEPHMHSMPSVVLHPDGNNFACQSLDNQIVVYNTKDKFRVNKKKRFIGHEIAGYACRVNISPDGHWVMSGDSEGKLWFWDWNTCKKMKILKSHEGVCIACEWHPIEPSKVATCGWDGTIKFWD